MRRLTLTLGILALFAATYTAAAEARTINVTPGHSIQAAVDAAEPGDTISIAPGTYTEAGRPCPSEPGHTCAVVVTKNDISIVRRSSEDPVVLQAVGDQDEGIAVGKSADPACLTDDSLQVNGSLIQGLTVKGFADDGVFLFCVDGFRVTQTRAIDNLEYGIFPSHSFNGRVDRSFASGANDTGIYIGQSHDARIDLNLATDNVSGFEIENSTRVHAVGNVATGNTGGILVFTLPGLDVKSNSDNEVDHNLVFRNNRDNTCLDPDDAVCGVPIGTGILVLAADDNRVHDNVVRGNNSFGIAVANFCVATQTPPDQCDALDIEPNPDGNRIVSNRVTENGHDPDLARLASPVFAVDLAWDGTGVGNCWSENVFDTSFPSSLPSC
jgi:parallel beta-helix repeat protein